MRKIILSLVLLTLGSSQARTLNEIKKSGVLEVKTNGPYSPFITEKDGVLGGFEIDLISAIAKKMGLKVHIQNEIFATLLTNLNKNKATSDVVIASQTITSTRAQEAEWVNHYCAAEVLLTRGNGPKTVPELAGSRAGAEANSVQYGFFRKLAHPPTLSTMTSADDAIKALAENRIDVTIVNRFVANDAVKANPRLQIGAVLWKNQKGIAVAKGNKELQQAIAAALKELMTDGTYKALS